MMTGMRPPTGPMGYAWTRVARPAITSTICSTKAISPVASPRAPVIRSGGVMFPNSIATRCWKPSGIASASGGRSSMS